MQPARALRKTLTLSRFVALSASLTLQASPLQNTCQASGTEAMEMTGANVNDCLVRQASVELHRLRLILCCC